MVLLRKNSILSVLCCLLFAMNAHATYVQWQGSYALARQEAHMQEKDILVLLVQKKNQHINKIIQESFMDQAYIAKLNQKFVAVIVEKGAVQSYPIELLYTQVFPSLFFLSHDELFLCKPLEGKITPAKIEEKLLECN